MNHPYPFQASIGPILIIVTSTYQKAKEISKKHDEIRKHLDTIDRGKWNNECDVEWLDCRVRAHFSARERHLFARHFATGPVRHPHWNYRENPRIRPAHACFGESLFIFYLFFLYSRIMSSKTCAYLPHSSMNFYLDIFNRTFLLHAFSCTIIDNFSLQIHFPW